MDINQLKVLTLFIAGFLGGWQVLNDFRDKKKRLKYTFFIYISLFGSLLYLTFKVENLQEDKAATEGQKQISQLVDSTELLLERTKRDMHQQFQSLGALNDRLRAQIDQNQQAIDRQYAQNKLGQQRLLSSASASLVKMDSAASLLDRVNLRQNHSINSLADLSVKATENLRSVAQVAGELTNVSLPIDKFRIKVTLRYEFKEPLIREYKNLFGNKPEGQWDPLVLARKSKNKEKRYLVGTAYTGYDQEVLNVSELKAYFCNFDRFDLFFVTDDPIKALADKDRGMIGLDKMTFGTTAEAYMPYYRYGSPNELFQDVVIDLAEIKSNIHGYRNYNDLFNDTYIGFHFYQLQYKSTSFKLQLKDSRNHKTEKIIKYDKISFLPQIHVYYGKDYSLTKFFDAKQHFQMLPSFMRWNQEAIKDMDVFEHLMVYHCLDFSKR